jgi:hypothetical protein
VSGKKYPLSGETPKSIDSQQYRKVVDMVLGKKAYLLFVFELAGSKT